MVNRLITPFNLIAFILSSLPFSHLSHILIASGQSDSIPSIELCHPRPTRARLTSIKETKERNSSIRERSTHALFYGNRKSKSIIHRFALFTLFSSSVIRIDTLS